MDYYVDYLFFFVLFDIFEIYCIILLVYLFYWCIRKWNVYLIVLIMVINDSYVLNVLFVIIRIDMIKKKWIYFCYVVKFYNFSIY